MKSYSVGIVDYGIGNHASVVHSLRDIGFRVVVTDKATDLDAVDVLILPGVGAFPPAMSSLHDRGLIDYLRKQANSERPLIGICLGMQLLTEASYEYKYTVGLGLIPGDIQPFPNHGNHIGWNTLKFLHMESRSSKSDGEAFYFNHWRCLYPDYPARTIHAGSSQSDDIDIVRRHPLRPAIRLPPARHHLSLGAFPTQAGDGSRVD
jgi:glutamine amidotransferase